MLTSNDQREYHRAVVNAVASQRLEGLEPDARTIADLQRAADGTLSVLDVINTLRARVAAGEFRSPSATE
ncbi:antitoxin VbhA family protein [Achromobacter sp. UMC46]|uniref:antitoxin VbhA family protein n=1 Tax=Achromobacter sp. UMC46 TaxID=1862319 RepID=UPI0015FFABEA|nr:antitoxin VbhA family protein [Achromobacter sp. UMC46]